VRQDERAPFVAALEDARCAAYPPGEYVGQEGFLTAGEIRQLAHRAGIVPGTSVLDVCCGVAGPGRLIVAESGCRYLGLDYAADAVRIARELTGDLPCRYAQALVPPLPAGRFDVVLLLETMLAFPDKRALLTEVTRVIAPAGRFACTLEAGRPLTARERAAMPDADTVWLIECGEFTRLLADAGLTPSWQQDCTESHRTQAEALLRSFRANSAAIARHVGAQAVAELIAAHRLWADWLGTGRVRKFAFVAERR
jgi:ubiquinone/menaquinone biosynthesis C-methylase UbiE